MTTLVGGSKDCLQILGIVHSSIIVAKLSGVIFGLQIS